MKKADLVDAIIKDAGLSIHHEGRTFFINPLQERAIRKWLYQEYQLTDVDFSVIQAFIEFEEAPIFEELEPDMVDELGFRYINYDRLENHQERLNSILEATPLYYVDDPIKDYFEYI